MKRDAAPIIAVILLLLLFVYVGSYSVLVSPRPIEVSRVATIDGTKITFSSYRFGGEYSRKFFWPLQQIDRRWVRPGAWESTVFP
jgi:hypothetical protein